MGIKSLLETARSVALKNSTRIHSIGTLPYHLVEDLLRTKTASELRHIEEESPHIITSTRPLWIRLIQRSFPSHGPISPPPKGKTWYFVYLQHEMDEKQRLEAARAKLKADTDRLKRQKLENQSGRVSFQSMPPLPKERRLPGSSSRSSRPQPKRSKLQSVIRTGVRPAAVPVPQVSQLVAQRKAEKAAREEEIRKRKEEREKSMIGAEVDELFGGEPESSGTGKSEGTSTKPTSELKIRAPKKLLSNANPARHTVMASQSSLPMQPPRDSSTIRAPRIGINKRKFDT